MARTRILVMAVWIGLAAGAAMAGPRDDLWKQVNDAIDKGLPKTADRGTGADHPRGLGGPGVRRGDQGHLHEDRPGGPDPGRQAGGDDRPAPGRDRHGPGADEARHGGGPGPLVLAVLPAESLAVHAADRRPPSRRARTSPPGTWPASWRRSTSTSRWPWRPRQTLKAIADRRVGRPDREGDRAGHVPADALRLPGLRGPVVLQLRRAGRGPAAGRLRDHGRQPDLRARGGVPRLGAADLGHARPPSSRPSGSTRPCWPSIRTTRTRPRSSTPICSGSTFGYNQAVGPEKADLYMAALERFVEPVAGARDRRPGPVRVGQRAVRAGELRRGAEPWPIGDGRPIPPASAASSATT